MKLDQWLKINKADQLSDLIDICRESKRDMRADPAGYTEHGTDEPSVDVRLCIDPTPRDGFDWIFRTGLVDYDPRHSRYCAAGSIGMNTDARDLLATLHEQILEQGSFDENL